MKKIVLHSISILLVLAIFYFLGREFIKNWEQIRSFTFHFNIPLLGLASLSYSLTFIVLAFGWHCLLKYLHHPIPFYETLLYFFITQPAKYIPGKIWIAVSRMKFCKKHAVPHSITFLTTGIEGGMEILGGAYISLVALLQLPTLGKFSLWGVMLASAAGVFFLIPGVFYFFVNLYLKIVKRNPVVREKWVSFSHLLILQIIYATGMLGIGISQVIFLQSFASVDPRHIPLLMSIGTFTYVASLLALFTPSGLGVREGIWYLALKNFLPNATALVYSFVSRLWMIILEGILMTISLPLLARVTQRQSHRVRNDGNS